VRSPPVRWTSPPRKRTNKSDACSSGASTSKRNSRRRTLTRLARGHIRSDTLPATGPACWQPGHQIYPSALPDRCKMRLVDRVAAFVTGELFRSALAAFKLGLRRRT
jgi:hypothetical protein